MNCALRIFVFALAVASSTSPAAVEEPDPYLWLEDLNSARTMDWVKVENAKTLGILTADSRFAAFEAQARAIAEAKDRIPSPQFLRGQVFNYWQDGEHVRGYWRHAGLNTYGQTDPQWQKVLDIDALARSENANWVWQGANCAEPQERRCLIFLSDGGEDASTVREFDLGTSAFVTGGFALPRGKQSATWEDEDTLLVAREWARGELTKSGYPYIVRRWKRGTPLESAREIFRGTASDLSVGAIAFQDGDGHQVLVIERSLSTFETEHYLIRGSTVRRLALPPKSGPAVLVQGQLIVSLAQDWSPEPGKTIPQGSLVALKLSSVNRDPAHLKPTILYSPGPRESFQAVMATRQALLVTTLDNVRGRAALYRLDRDGRWTHKLLPLPDNAAIGLVDADIHSDRAFLQVTGFLQPPSVVLADARSGRVTTVRTLTPQFDASQCTVEQLEATSSDGTRIPYFIVHRASMRRDGENPTIFYAYGGFQVSELPEYSGTLGKLWLERGGVYVLANIRGGGEFGPAWHEVGLKTHRQIIYDDFTAVARDLITRQITSPRRLGIEGGSNGGLLMGVEFTQHPELWNAVDIQVPLLDMLRSEKIAAGSAWVGEYGSVSVPEERAFLASISPYANVKRGVAYPEPLIWTNGKDDRVGPQHARKFAARLAEFRIPYLYYESIEGGHAAGANLEEQARTQALEMIYFTRKLMD